jgi:hypothetical protein
MLLAFARDALSGLKSSAEGLSDTETACRICDQSQGPMGLVFLGASMLG